MREKEESEKAVLKLNIKKQTNKQTKTTIMTSSIQFNLFIAEKK